MLLSVISLALVMSFYLFDAVIIKNCMRINNDIQILPDLSFLQGLFDLFPFTLDDIEARSAIWSIIAKVLMQVEESLMSSSILHQYVLVFVSKSELTEEDLLDHQLGTCEDGAKSSDRTTAVSFI